MIKVQPSPWFYLKIVKMKYHYTQNVIEKVKA